MDYNNAFANELSQLAKNKDILDLPLDIYDYIKAKIISDADSTCNYYMSEMKKMVSRGEYKYVNGKRVVSRTCGLTTDIKLFDNIKHHPTTYLLEKYFSDGVNANALSANRIRRSYCEGLVEYRMCLFETNFDCQQKENFFGFKEYYSFDIQKTPFADLYLNALKENLRRNGISYQITLEFYRVQNPSKNRTTVKKYDITNSFPHIHESFETPRAGTKSKVDSFTYQMLIETTVSF